MPGCIPVFARCCFLLCLVALLFRSKYKGKHHFIVSAASTKGRASRDAKDHINKAITYTQRSFVINGKPTLLFSGSIHYVRVPPADWENVLRYAKELGLNCIQTYVIWSEHEQSQGKFNWEGYGDLIRFIELAAAHDLYVVVRIGPYICGEYYFGGIPLWMRHMTDGDGREIECFRCVDPLWKREMKRWVSIVVNKIKHLFAANGGHIIWMQIENEYDKDDDYLQFCAEMARNTTTEVPWSLCGHNITQCNQLNNNLRPISDTEEASRNAVLCTVNGFWVEGQDERGSQPGPEFFRKLWADNSTLPAVWTEDQGWFDVWGMAHRVRWTSDQLYGMARFFAYGGAYHNFYMLTGGNNYGLRAGRDATTAYAPDTVIDNLLLRHEPRFSSFRRFFLVLRSVENDLLMHPVPVSPIPLNYSQPSASDPSKASTGEVHAFGSIAFLSNYGEIEKESVFFAFMGDSYFLPNHTVVMLNTSTNHVLFNTSAPLGNVEEREQNPKQLFQRINVSDWAFFREKVAYGAIKNGPQTSPEQLNFTDNQSDYCWYTFLTNSEFGKIKVNGIGWGGLYYVYVNGVLRDSIDFTDGRYVSYVKRRLTSHNRKAYNNTSKVHVFSVAMGMSNQKKVDILSVAMGLNTVVSPQEGKGVKSVSIGSGNPPHTIFSTSWKLRGEELEIYADKGADRVKWESMSSDLLGADDGLFWLRGRFDIPRGLQAFAGGAQPNQTSLVVNLRGLQKGVAWVNGFNIGRYWLIRGKCAGDCAPPRHGKHCFLHYESCGKPTQHLYHIPFEVLKPTGNTLTLFEESASSRQRSLNDVFVQVVRKHPYHDDA